MSGLTTADTGRGGSWLVVGEGCHATIIFAPSSAALSPIASMYDTMKKELFPVIHLYANRGFNIVDVHDADHEFTCMHNDLP